MAHETRYARRGDAQGRKKSKTRKRNGKAPQCPNQCLPQVDACQGLLVPGCAGSPKCADLVACCEVLRTCDAEEFLTCLADIVTDVNDQLSRAI